MEFNTQIRMEDLRAFFMFTIWVKQKHVTPIMVFAFGVGAALLAGGGWRLWAGTALLAAVFWYVYSRLRMWSRFKKAVAGQADDKYSVSVDNKGVLMQNLSRNQKVLHGWDSIIEARELKKYFLLYQSQVSALIIPKRSLSLSQQDQLDKMLRSRLKGKYTYA